MTVGESERRLKKLEGQRRSGSIPETIKLGGKSALADGMDEGKQTNSHMRFPSLGRI